MHVAHGRRQLERAQDIVHRIAVKPIVTIRTLRLAGSNNVPPVLSRQLVSSHPTGKAPAQHAVQPLFQQRRAAVGIKRMLEHNDVVLAQQRLLIRDVDKKIGVVRVEIVHRYITEP